jgi:hypothetical protein
MRNKQLQNEIELEAHNLDIGESVSDLLCPFCHGGQSGERKFSITRTDSGLVYNCFRASCFDGRGFVATKGALPPGLPKKEGNKSKWKGPYTGTFEPLEEKDIAYFKRRFDLDISSNSFLGVNSSNLYVMEVRTMDGYVRGYAVRRGCWTVRSDTDPVCPRTALKTDPKTKVFLSNADDVSLSWHLPQRSRDAGRLFVVEDQVSAAKVAQSGYVGVALMGAYLGEDKVKEISKWHPKEVTIALDADATGEAFKAVRKWGLAFPKTKVLVLRQDIKDMTKAAVQELLK